MHKNKDSESSVSIRSDLRDGMHNDHSKSVMKTHYWSISLIMFWQIQKCMCIIHLIHLWKLEMTCVQTPLADLIGY